MAWSRFISMDTLIIALTEFPSPTLELKTCPPAERRTPKASPYERLGSPLRNIDPNTQGVP